jgi:hypothetical protein
MRSGALLLEGAHHEQPLRWLYQQYPDHEPRLLLRHTAYEEIADFGPVLVQADEGSSLYSAWWQGKADLLSAVWLEPTMPVERLFKVLQRRLRIHAPDGREFWLRLGDAAPLRQAWRVGAQWPSGFWHGVSAVWLQHDGAPILAWSNQTPEVDCAPADSGLVAQATLDWPLLEALTLNTDSDKEAQG